LARRFADKRILRLNFTDDTAKGVATHHLVDWDREIRCHRGSPKKTHYEQEKQQCNPPLDFGNPSSHHYREQKSWDCDSSEFEDYFDGH